MRLEPYGALPWPFAMSNGEVQRVWQEPAETGASMNSGLRHHVSTMYSTDFGGPNSMWELPKIRGLA